jgi:phage-related protein
MKFIERKIVFHGEHFAKFYSEQQPSVQEKIEYVLRIVRLVERVPKKFLDHIQGSEGLYEIRVEFESNIYRIFCCFDEGFLVILFNGFQKKTQKTPQIMLEKATRLKQEYFEMKERQLHEKRRNQKR